MQATFTNKQLNKRATQLLRSVRNLAPDSDAITELVEVTEALSDQPVKPVVVARLTVQRANGIRLIVEVQSDSTFSTFYKFHTQQGARRSTKRFLHNQSRNMGMRVIGYHQPGLESVAAQIQKYADPSNPIVKMSIRILQRKAYRKLIGARPDQLGLTQMSSLPIYSRVVRAS
jgi:hypothetical protein